MLFRKPSEFLLFVVVATSCSCVATGLHGGLSSVVAIDANEPSFAVESHHNMLRLRNSPPSCAIGQSLRLKGGSSFAKQPSENASFNSKKLLVAKDSVVWLSKGILAAFTGLLTTSSVLVAFEYTAHKMYPEAMTDGGRVAQSLAAMVLVGALVGSGLGGWVIARLAPSHPCILASFVGLLFTIAQYLNLQTLDHPGWYNTAALCAFLPPYLLTSSAITSGSAGRAAAARFVAAASALSPRKYAARPAPTAVTATADAAPDSAGVADASATLGAADATTDLSESEAPSSYKATTAASDTPAAEARKPTRKAATRTPAKTPRRKTVRPVAE